MQSFSLHGRVALVTGSSRGIGQAVAIALAEAGADIIGVSSRHGANDQTASMVTDLGKAFHAYTVDIADRAALLSFTQQVITDHPRIDILINNAGSILRKPAADHPDEYWDQILDVNLNAPFILTREIGRQMISNGYGKIVFTASLLSFQGGINVPGYAASKGAVASLLKAFANEWAPFGITVNGVAPGYIATENTLSLRNDEGRNSAILSRIPAGRWGTPEDLKGAFVFLASPASNYVNGTILTVDGGWMGR